MGAYRVKFKPALSQLMVCFFPENGQFLTLDLWGNHFRVLLVTINGNETEVETSQGLIPTKILEGTGEAVCRALDKREYLIIIRDNFR